MQNAIETEENNTQKLRKHFAKLESIKMQIIVQNQSLTVYVIKMYFKNKSSLAWLRVYFELEANAFQCLSVFLAG